MTIVIRRERLCSEIASTLITALNAEMSAAYAEREVGHFRLDAGEVADGSGAFLVALRDGAPVGCGAVRLLAPGTAELKRMYVVPSARGGGVGRLLLDALESEARRLGSGRLVLETGVRQTAALALYHRAGFTPIPPFGEYAGSPTSVCLAKDLV